MSTIPAGCSQGVLGKTIDNVASAHGVKLVIRIPFRSFLEPSSTNEIDEFIVYAPYELIRQFAQADITSQALIDVFPLVICNDNRMEVALTESSNSFGLSSSSPCPNGLGKVSH